MVQETSGREPLEEKGAPAARRKGVSRKYALALLAFSAAAAVFAAVLAPPRPKTETPPAKEIDAKTPEFSLPPVQGRTLGLSSADLKGGVSLVNVFASWCEACKREHPFLMELAKRNIVPIHGLNFKDKPADAQAWLDGRGDPYARTGADIDGRVAKDWKIKGIPVTFVVDPMGETVYKRLGVLNAELFEEEILPLIDKFQEKIGKRNNEE